VIHHSVCDAQTSASNTDQASACRHAGSRYCAAEPISLVQPLRLSSRSICAHRFDRMPSAISWKIPTCASVKIVLSSRYCTPSTSKCIHPSMSTLSAMPRWALVYTPTSQLILKDHTYVQVVVRHPELNNTRCGAKVNDTVLDDHPSFQPTLPASSSLPRGYHLLYTQNDFSGTRRAPIHCTESSIRRDLHLK